MNWEQKLEALQAITRCELCMRSPGNWYVSAHSRGVVSGEDGWLLEGSYGNGRSPQEAIEDDWQKIAESRLPVKVDGVDYKTTRYVQWNGYMWRELTHEQACLLAKPSNQP
jgi:hypothetical protein